MKRTRFSALALIVLSLSTTCTFPALAESTIKIVATNHEGLAEAVVELWLERVWKEGWKENAAFYYIDGGRLGDGTSTFSVPPGNYIVSFKHYVDDAYSRSFDWGVVARDARIHTVHADFATEKVYVESSSPKPSGSDGSTSLTGGSGLVITSDPCQSWSAFCLERDGTKWCAEPGQTEVSCGVVQTLDPSATPAVIDVLSSALSLAGMSNTSFQVDVISSTITVAAATLEGDAEATRDRLIEVLLKVSFSGLTGASGVAAIVSEPVIVEDRIMVRVRLPFVFLQGQPDVY